MGLRARTSSRQIRQIAAAQAGHRRACLRAEGEVSPAKIFSAQKTGLGGSLMYDAMLAETITIPGHGGDEIEAYLARPLGRAVRRRRRDPPHARLRPRDQGDHPEIRRPRLHRAHAEPLLPGGARRQPGRRGRRRAGQGRRARRAPGRRRRRGSRPPAGPAGSNGKVGIIGYCSGGRQSFLAACSLQLDAAVDCYGAFVVGTPPEGIPLKVGPIEHLAKDLSCPLLGLFGAEDQYPSPEEVDELEEEPDRPRQDLRVPQLRGRRPRVLRRGPPRLPARGRDRRLAEDLRFLRPLPGLLTQPRQPPAPPAQPRPRPRPSQPLTRSPAP